MEMHDGKGKTRHTKAADKKTRLVSTPLHGVAAAKDIGRQNFIDYCILWAVTTVVSTSFALS